MEKDLLLIAKKHELLGFQKNENILSKISALEAPLNYVYGICRPSSLDYDQRRDLIRIFNQIAKDIYGNHDECPVVEEFGSFLMDMFNAESDLDLSINFHDKRVISQRDAKIKVLRKFTNKLRALQKLGHVANVQPIYTARVPVLKVTDRGTGIECDLSVGNLDGIVKSHIIRLISAIDERFQKLSFLMKTWAHAQDINSSKDGTLNSLSLILLVAFHLQTRNPPIFPPFSAILKDGIDPVAVKKIVPSFLNYGKENKESLAELFVSLLIVLESVDTLWSKGLCVSVFDGSWMFKTWESKKGEKFGCFSIEDFTDRSQNTARAVQPREFNQIYDCIRGSLQQIRSFVDGEINAVELKFRLFDRDPVVARKGSANNNTRSRRYPTLEGRKRKKPAKSASVESRKDSAKSNGKKVKKLNVNSHLPSAKSGKDSAKPNVSSHLPSTPFQRGAARVDRPKEIVDASKSNQSSHFSAINSHHAPHSLSNHNPPLSSHRPPYFPNHHYPQYPQHPHHSQHPLTPQYPHRPHHMQHPSHPQQPCHPHHPQQSRHPQHPQQPRHPQHVQQPHNPQHSHHLQHLSHPQQPHHPQYPQHSRHPHHPVHHPQLPQHPHHRQQSGHPHHQQPHHLPHAQHLQDRHRAFPVAFGYPRGGDDRTW